MVKVVGTEQMVVPVDIATVSAGEDIFAPGVQKFAFLVEDDDRMFTSVEYVDPVLAIYGDAGHLNE